MEVEAAVAPVVVVSTDPAGAEPDARADKPSSVKIKLNFQSGAGIRM